MFNYGGYIMDEKLFRKAMSKFATGITVVTIDDEDEVQGMTVNAFMSISLNPKLIAVSIGDQASLYEKILEKKQFGLNILSDQQKDLLVIDPFADRIINLNQFAFFFKYYPII